MVAVPVIRRDRDDLLYIRSRLLRDFLRHELRRAVHGEVKYQFLCHVDELLYKSSFSSSVAYILIRSGVA